MNRISVNDVFLVIDDDRQAAHACLAFVSLLVTHQAHFVFEGEVRIAREVTGRGVTTASPGCNWVFASTARPLPSEDIDHKWVDEMVEFGLTGTFKLFTSEKAHFFDEHAETL